MTLGSLDGAGSPQVMSRSELLTAGCTDGQLRRARRSGALAVLLPGVYLSGGDLPDLGLLEWHLATVAAALRRLSGRPVVSHLTAAMLLGLLPPCIGRQPVHITRSAPAKSRRGQFIVTHRGSLTPGDVLTVAGLPVTSPVRTALDCAFWLPYPEAVAVLTSVMAANRLTPAALLTELARYRRVPGVRQVAGMVAAAGRGGALTAPP